MVPQRTNSSWSLCSRLFLVHTQKKSYFEPESVYTSKHVALIQITFSCLLFCIHKCIYSDIWCPVSIWMVYLKQAKCWVLTLITSPSSLGKSHMRVIFPVLKTTIAHISAAHVVRVSWDITYCSYLLYHYRAACAHIPVCSIREEDN